MKKNNPDIFYELFILTYIGLNGVAVGGSISSIRHLIAHPNTDDFSALILWLGLAGYTAHRIHKVRHDQQNNQKQR